MFRSARTIYTAAAEIEAMVVSRDGKYHEVFENIENIENIGYFRYFHFTVLDWLMSIERLVFKLYIYRRSLIGSPIIVTIGNVVFANKSETLR